MYLKVNERKKMMVIVEIPTALQKFTEGLVAIPFDGNTTSDILRELVQKYPDLKSHIFDEKGDLRKFLNIYLNDENIRYFSWKETAVKDGDVVMIVPAVAGGSQRHVNTSAKGVCAGNASEELSNEELERYSRHLLIPEIGISGQKRINNAKVLCIGAGGLGSPLLMYLAAAGVGRIGLVDFDFVDVSNLQRQIIHRTKNVGRSKLLSAKESMEDINPLVQIDLFDEQITSKNVTRILEPYDIVVDGTDNFESRYLINDACVHLGKPNVYGSIFQFEGQASVFFADEGPCYRCLYPERPPAGFVPSCSEGGVLGVLPGIVGTIQAAEAIKLILGIGDSLIGRLLLIDAKSMKFKQLNLQKDPGCQVCGENSCIDKLVDFESSCENKNDDESLEAEFLITPRHLDGRLREGDNILLLDVRDSHEQDICRIPGSTNIPLYKLKSRMEDLDRELDIVIHCRSGVRSAEAVTSLRKAGFNRVKSLMGGILAWADDVDPEMPRY